MRITNEVADISYDDTKDFFRNRAGKFQEDNPYAVTMYQDDHKELVTERNKKEIEKLLPLLHINRESKILDIACGIGRWADAVSEDILEYCGVDFSADLIAIAKKRNTKKQFSFYEFSVIDIEKLLRQEDKGCFNTVLFMGIFMYLNDRDIISLLEQAERNCEEHAVICIREPIGIQSRLTLKDYFSDELKDTYNAIYRTREELMDYIQTALINKGFSVTKEGFLFNEEALNNRKETSQYYFILER